MNLAHIFQNFKDKWLNPAGQRIDYDHVYLYQCVDLILEYLYECFGIRTGVSGNAIDYWNKPSAALLQKFAKVHTTDVNVGDIVVLNGLPGNPYGHIVIATGNENATQFEALEQNGSTGHGTGTGKDAIRTRWINKDRIAGLLRFIVIPPKPAPTEPTAIHPYWVEKIAPKQVVSTVARVRWNLDDTAWPQFNTNPTGSLAPEVPVTVVAIAHHKLGGSYYMEDPNKAEGYNVVDVHDFHTLAPQPAPAPAPAPEPAAAPAEPANPFELLAAPLDLVTKLSPTSLWDLTSATDDWKTFKATTLLPLGTPFRAVAKYKHPLGGVYFVDQEAYDSRKLVGINTVDLQPAPAKEQPAVTITPAAAATPAAVAGEGDDHIQVKVLPGNPDAWKATYKTNAAGEYTANANTLVYDLADPTAEPQQLVKAQLVHVAGSFTGPDKIEYYRTHKSVEAKTFRGIPTVALSAESLASDAEMLLSPNFIQDAKEEIGKFSVKEKAIRKIASAEVNGLVKRLKRSK